MDISSAFLQIKKPEYFSSTNHLECFEDLINNFNMSKGIKSRLKQFDNEFMIILERIVNGVKTNMDENLNPVKVKECHSYLIRELPFLLQQITKKKIEKISKKHSITIEEKTSIALNRWKWNEKKNFKFIECFESIKNTTKMAVSAICKIMKVEDLNEVTPLMLCEIVDTAYYVNIINDTDCSLNETCFHVTAAHRNVLSFNLSGNEVQVLQNKQANIFVINCERIESVYNEKFLAIESKCDENYTVMMKFMSEKAVEKFLRKKCLDQEYKVYTIDTTIGGMISQYNIRVNLQMYKDEKLKECLMSLACIIQFYLASKDLDLIHELFAILTNKYSEESSWDRVLRDVQCKTFTYGAAKINIRCDFNADNLMNGILISRNKNKVYAYMRTECNEQLKFLATNNNDTWSLKTYQRQTLNDILVLNGYSIDEMFVYNITCLHEDLLIAGISGFKIYEAAEREQNIKKAPKRKRCQVFDDNDNEVMKIEFTAAMTSEEIDKEYSQAADFIKKHVHIYGSGYEINRVGTEIFPNEFTSADGTKAHKDMGPFYGSTYLATPEGCRSPGMSRDDDGILICEVDLNQCRQSRDLHTFRMCQRLPIYAEGLAKASKLDFKPQIIREN
ncbi:unnamed protein product [Chironomus riparius]|uniref:Uncharacterized protein n=1 Tax=Chironomus riparius TaxID=315576 RepID=A0A9N9RI89_9DIPT|nr:unnamed protein product [Chironomus riparius]